MDFQIQKAISADTNQAVESNSFVGQEENQPPFYKDFSSQFEDYLKSATDSLHYKFMLEEPSIGIHFLSDIRDHISGSDVLDTTIFQDSPKQQGIKRKRNFDTPETPTHICKYCTKTFNQRSQLDLHYLKHHKHQIPNIEAFLNSKIYNCDVCPYETILLHDLKRHLLVHERNGADIPKSIEESSLNLLNSEISITPSLSLPNDISVNETFTCSICNEKFDVKKRLNAHLVKMHKNEFKNLVDLPKFKVHACELCSYETTHSHNFKKHMEVHAKRSVEVKKPVDATPVSKRKKPIILDDELEMVDNMYSCPVCIYQTSDKDDLKNHLNIHAQLNDQDDNFQCDQCDYKSTKKLRFLKHLLVHTDVKPYECSACERGFIKKIQLESHILTQHRDDENLVRCISSKIHYCDHCSYKTVVIQMMKNHMKNKHKDKNGPSGSD